RDQRQREDPPPAAHHEHRQASHVSPSRSTTASHPWKSRAAQRTLDLSRHARGRMGMGAKRELTDLLADVRLFSKCSARQRRTVARHAQIASLPAGVDLIIEGEPGDALFVILEGEA